MQIERVVVLARQLLTIPIIEPRRDLWLWEHSERVMRLTQALRALPEIAGQTPDPDALAAAALFHDAGWALECQDGRCERWQMVARPTNDIQRELGAALLQEQAGHLLPGPTLRLACDAIRQCNSRRTELLEATILAEAEALDEVGPVYLLRQFRQYQGEGRPLQQLVDSWQRQKEYHYWEVRLAEGFHYETTRTLARRRLEAVDAFVTALGRDLRGDDVTDALKVALPESPLSDRAAGG